MAQRAQPISALMGRAVSLGVLGLIAATIVAVLFRADRASGLGPSDWAAIRFTVGQAALSAVLSVGLAIPAARALARRNFPLKPLAITLLGAPFLLPVLVAAMGLIAVFGRSGLVSDALALVGLPPVQIYGLHGVILAHVFFNLPLATRMILQGWLAIPAERFRLAYALGFSSADTARHLERPMLWTVVPGALLVIFLICTTSFAVALILGGGPRATTIELAIYQAFRFDFDLAKAGLLGLIQLGICIAAVVMARGFPVPDGMGAGLDRALVAIAPRSAVLRAQDTVLIGAVILFLLTPLSMIVIKGAPSLFVLPAEIWGAALRSVCVALASVGLTLALALPLSFALADRSRLADLATSMPVALSPLVFGLGAFVIVFPWVDPRSIALPITALANALLSLPFVTRILVPSVRALRADYGRLSVSLGITGLAWARWVALPRLRRPLGFGAGLAAALSMGDLGVVILFSDGSGGTLPLMLYRLLGAYRVDEAAGAALLLLLLSLLLFWIFDRGGRSHAAI